MTVITDANGCATAPALTSNLAAGSYVVTAQAAGLTTIAEFHLANVYGIDTLYDPNKANHSGSTIPLKVEITDDAGNNLGSIDVLVQALFVDDRGRSPV